MMQRVMFMLRWDTVQINSEWQFCTCISNC